MKAVFDTIAPAVGLSVGLAVGQSSVAAEASELVKVHLKMVHAFESDEPLGGNRPIVESKIDILVATPGRLMDHLRGTTGFTIEHLQYLVCIPVYNRQSKQFLSCSSYHKPLNPYFINIDSNTSNYNIEPKPTIIYKVDFMS